MPAPAYASGYRHNYARPPVHVYHHPIYPSEHRARNPEFYRSGSIQEFNAVTAESKIQPAPQSFAPPVTLPSPSHFLPKMDCSFSKGHLEKFQESLFHRITRQVSPYKICKGKAHPPQLSQAASFPQTSATIELTMSEADVAFLTR